MWTKEDSFLAPKKQAPFNPPTPGNIGGVKPSPATMQDPPEPYVCEKEGTDEMIEARSEYAKPGDTPKPVATDAGMNKGEEANFRASGEDSHEQVFVEPQDREE